MNPIRVEVWCNQAISSSSEIALHSVANNISKRFNVSLLLDVMSLSFSSGKAYQVLERIMKYRKETRMYVVTNLDLKWSWLWAKMLGSMESVVLGVVRPGKNEGHENQVSLESSFSTKSVF